jgi:CRP-like cAMP-binding protein
MRDLNLEFSVTKHLKKGEVWDHRLDLAHSMVTLVSGMMCFYALDGQGGETVLCFCGPGKSFHLPAEAMGLPQVQDYHFRALGETVLGLAPLAQAATAALALSFFHQFLTQDFAALSRHLVLLHSQDALSRYERMIAEQPDVLRLASNAELAAYLHTSRETISRIRKKLAAGGGL